MKYQGNRYSKNVCKVTMHSSFTYKRYKFNLKRFMVVSLILCIYVISYIVFFGFKYSYKLADTFQLIDWMIDWPVKSSRKLNRTSVIPQINAWNALFTHFLRILLYTFCIYSCLCLLKQYKHFLGRVLSLCTSTCISTKYT